MPSSVVKSEDSKIYRIKEEGGLKDPVSNFGISVLASVHVASDAGGPGLLLKIKRYPDNVEKVIFCPMSEVSGTVKHFLISVNQQFPGGALFLLLSDHEFRKLMMDMTNTMMEDGNDHQLHAARMIGRNCIEKSVFWVMSENVQIASDGELAQPEDTPLMWLRRLVNGNNTLLQESLACKVATPLDDGDGLIRLCLAIRCFMPENFLAAMATASACIMGASYTAILSVFGCCGVPMLTGPPGSCKSEATKCGLSLYGAHDTHSCNNQTTPSYLFSAASKTTIPICVDDVSEKSADSWEELIIDAYNGTGRGTRSYGVEVFHTLPILSANWKVGMDRPRAHTRVIQIPFSQHEDEPEANLLFANMAHCREIASRSLGELIRLSQRFEMPDTKEFINHSICPSVARILCQFGAPARFTTTMSVFMYFFLELSKLAGTFMNQDDCWNFFAENMAPYTSVGACEATEDAGFVAHGEACTSLVHSFLEVLARKVQELDTYRVLQVISLDVKTACHLGVCIAVRINEAITTVNEDPHSPLKFSVTTLTRAIKMSGIGKHSKQRFLKASCKDDTIKTANKGAGGNTVPYKCQVIQQSVICDETMELLRNGLARKNHVAQNSGEDGMSLVAAPLSQPISEDFVLEGTQMDNPLSCFSSPMQAEVKGVSCLPNNDNEDTPPDSKRRRKL